MWVMLSPEEEREEAAPRARGWAMDQWLRRRVRMYYWKQWKRARGRRRNLIRLGIHPAEVYKATRSHRGYWWMAGSSIVQRALDTRWLTERGVPNIRQQWIEMHYGQRNERFNPEAANLTGTAGCGPARPACPVVALAKTDGVGGGRLTLPPTRLGKSGLICVWCRHRLPTTQQHTPPAEGSVPAPRKRPRSSKAPYGA